jgi:UDP-3-O-[3-hydroxymyristoyl] glucosamine N-acyltransferase
MEGGVPVFSRLEDVPFRPDIIHGHHHVETTLALMHFRSVPGIFVCHDRFAWHDVPPRLSAIRRYVAVDRNCFERIVIEAGVPEERTRVVLNAVDMERFAPRGPLPDAPARALVFSNYATYGPAAATLFEGCRNAGLELALVGSGVGAATSRPEEVLGKYDLVFAKARCALEALAAGCAVILCDRWSFGSMVTRSQVQELRNWNFGMRCLPWRLTTESISREIARYDRHDAAEVARFVRADASLDRAVLEYLSIYEEVLAESSDICVSVENTVESLARKIGDLESGLREAAWQIAMPPVPRKIAPEIHLYLSGKVPRMTVGQMSRIEVVIDNRSMETLASRSPYPVHVSYHWFSAGMSTCVVFDGKRTLLSSPVRPQSRIIQGVDVLPPDNPGSYVLVLTLVQEFQLWFDALPVPVALKLDVKVGLAGSITRLDEASLEEVAAWGGAEVVRDGSFANLGFLSDPTERMLTFVESWQYATLAASTQQVCALLATPELAELVPDRICLAVTDDPKASFFEIHNRLVSQTEFYGQDFATVIDPSAELHPRCWVDERNVTIAAGVRIGPNAVVQGRATIGEGVAIQAGAVIGSVGFQTSNRFSDGIELLHAGGVEIGTNCHILANAVIARGLFRGVTRIGEGCRVGNCAFVSHNCSIGDWAFIGHGAVLNGTVRVGKNAWIGPGATVVNAAEIGDAASVSLGATVVRDVEPNTRVTGSLAIVHRRMLRMMAEAEKDPEVK